MVNRNTTIRAILESKAISLYTSLNDSLPENTFGEKIYKLRNSNGLGRDKFAEIVGIHTSTVKSWEDGKKKPTQKLIAMVCAAFVLDSAYFDEN